MRFSMHKQFVGKLTLQPRSSEVGGENNSPERQRRERERIKNRNLSSLGPFLPSRHFVACEKMCCIFEASGSRDKGRLYESEYNYFEVSERVCACIWRVKD